MPVVSAGSLERRIGQARAALERCDLCELRCGTNRRAGERGQCGLGAQSRCYRRHMSLAEELELLPSYMVYFSGCNLRCRFCMQVPASVDGEAGEPLGGAELAAIAAGAVKEGAKTVNLVGGEPSLHVHTILEAAAASERPRPWVLNSNMMMTPRVIEWLSGVVSLYLGDFKYGNDGCAAQLAGAKDYWRIVTRNLLAAAGTGRVLVRHLLLPGHVDCCFRPVAAWMARNLPGAAFHVMFSYVQGPGSWSEGQLGRLVNAAEVAAAREWLESLGLVEYEQASAPER